MGKEEGKEGMTIGILGFFVGVVLALALLVNGCTGGRPQPDILDVCRQSINKHPFDEVTLRQLVIFQGCRALCQRALFHNDRVAYDNLEMCRQSLTNPASGIPESAEGQSIVGLR
jgi:hypothetical protein